MGPVDEPLFSGPEVCRAAGVTYRQLDYWDRTGVICPSQPARGSGTQRGYTLAEAQAVALVGALPTDHRLPVGAIMAVWSGAPFARIVPAEPGSRARIEPFTEEDLRALVRSSFTMVEIVNVEAIRDRVAEALLDPSVAAS